jgi:fatty acid desaturase
MKINEGKLDRTLRMSTGLILIGLAATGIIGLWGYIGVIPLLTGAIGICPIYSLLGKNTCPVGTR